jgi:murein L,D-transpeptidase YafK
MMNMLINCLNFKKQVSTRCVLRTYINVVIYTENIITKCYFHIYDVVYAFVNLSLIISGASNEKYYVFIMCMENMNINKEAVILIYLKKQDEAIFLYLRDTRIEGKEQDFLCFLS